MFLFKILRKIVGAIILIAIVVPIFAIGKTWISAHNSTIATAEHPCVLAARDVSSFVRASQSAAAVRSIATG